MSDTQVSAVLTSLYTLVGLEDDDQGTYSQSGVPPSTLLSNVKMKAREVMNEYELQDDQAASLTELTDMDPTDFDAMLKDLQTSELIVRHAGDGVTSVYLTNKGKARVEADLAEAADLAEGAHE